jgi:hypothetical protein
MREWIRWRSTWWLDGTGRRYCVRKNCQWVTFEVIQNHLYAFMSWDSSLCVTASVIHEVNMYIVVVERRWVITCDLFCDTGHLSYCWSVIPMGNQLIYGMMMMMTNNWRRLVWIQCLLWQIMWHTWCGWWRWLSQPSSIIIYLSSLLPSVSHQQSHSISHLYSTAPMLSTFIIYHYQVSRLYLCRANGTWTFL